MTISRARSNERARALSLWPLQKTYSYGVPNRTPYGNELLERPRYYEFSKASRRRKHISLLSVGAAGLVRQLAPASPLAHGPPTRIFERSLNVYFPLFRLARGRVSLSLLRHLPRRRVAREEPSSFFFTSKSLGKMTRSRSRRPRASRCSSRSSSRGTPGPAPRRPASPPPRSSPPRTPRSSPLCSSALCVYHPATRETRKTHDFFFQEPSEPRAPSGCGPVPSSARAFRHLKPHLIFFP